ncbi:MAG: hypothetical protein IKJ19_02075 [Clostridia bacterium]|nr:hypothetical protein [Clostridia bacterium]
MDNKITKRRLTNLLAYDWIKIIIIIVAVILVWSLAFTIGAPRASTGQVFNVFYYGEFSYQKSPSVINYEAKNSGAYSYDVLSLDARELYLDYYATIMSAVSSTHEGDIMITVDSMDKIQSNSSEFRNFVDGYGYEIYDYDSLIKDAKNYCLLNSFVLLQNDGSYALNERAIKSHFAKRMQKDPRFKNKDGEKYKQGELNEIARIKSVWNNAIMLEDCLNNHSELRYNYKRFAQLIQKDPDNYKDEVYHNTQELTYGLNLSALSGGQVDVNTEYSKPIFDENGTHIYSNPIVMCVFNYLPHQPDLQFESLGFVNFMIKKYSNFLNDNALGVIA